jgi:peptide/nickel transport system ATP-binding protein
MTVWRVDDLAVTIGGRRVVEGLSYAVEAGSCVALIGESGSGKTQSCLAPFGLSPGIAGGSARLMGAELVGLDEAALRVVRGRDAGFVFQQPLSALTPHLTVGAQLAEAMGGDARAADLRAALDEVGIDDPAQRLRQFPHQLSGGQRQRVMIACALAHRPRLLIADEPTTALDARLRKDVLRLLDRLRAERSLAVVLISHDLGLVADHADDIVVMRGGGMVEAGAARTLIAAPRERYTRDLVAAAPRLGAPTGEHGSVGQPLLEGRGVTVRFRRPGWRSGWFDAVADADLVIREGEAVALVGGSGSGKSTLARALGRLGPMQAGVLSWRGAELPKRRRLSFQQRRDIQIVAQDPVDSLDPLWPAARSIAEGFDPMRGRIAPSRLAELMAEVGLEADLAARRPSALSGGQAQRVAIARALAADPALLICDEATSALDVTVQAQVVALLHRLVATRGLALLFITHDLALARALCHRLVVMDAGRIVEMGPVDDVIASPAHAATRALVDGHRRQASPQ